MGDDRILKTSSGGSSLDIESALEESRIVYFPRCPFPLPAEADMAFLRNELPLQTRLKNVSYHPESDTVPRFEAPPAVQGRVRSILRSHSRAVTGYLESVLPNLSPGWTVGTCSFRSLEEKGRNLKPRSSNEIVHIDAGAYGATCGDRILRFFVNVNPRADRVWATKGSFDSLFREYEAFLQAAKGDRKRLRVQKGILDRCYSGLVAAISKGYPLARVIDSSPYDRAMRRIHNYMKETEAFRADPAHYQELRFPPFSSWMVFTDSVSHAVLSGQHALVTTMLIRLSSCRQPQLSPYRVLEAAA